MREAGRQIKSDLNKQTENRCSYYNSKKEFNQSSMSQNNQNRFAALSPASAANQPKRNSRKNSRGSANDEGEEPLLEETKQQLINPANADKAFQAVVGADRYRTAQVAAEQQEEEYEDSSEGEIDESSREVVKIVNVHKTYLLGIEGVPALRGVNLTI